MTSSQSKCGYLPGRPAWEICRRLKIQNLAIWTLAPRTLRTLLLTCSGRLPGEWNQLGTQNGLSEMQRIQPHQFALGPFEDQAEVILAGWVAQLAFNGPILFPVSRKWESTDPE
jgi:hypothetical protein